MISTRSSRSGALALLSGFLGMATFGWTTSCQSPTRYEGRYYRANLDSVPTGADLYVVEAAEWQELGQGLAALSPQMIESQALAVGVPGGEQRKRLQTPALGIELKARPLVLVAVLGERTGWEEIHPAAHDENFTVSIP